MDNRFSDDSFNPPDFDKDGNIISGTTGHAFRFYPLKDENGDLVPNTYIMANDYTANQFVNWDYNDNVYIVTNIKPADSGVANPFPPPVKAEPTDLFAPNRTAANLGQDRIL